MMMIMMGIMNMLKIIGLNKINKMNIQELVKDELQFCREIECEKNEHDQFIYISKNGVSSMNLPYVLQEYKQWLIDKGIVGEKGV